MYREWKKIEFSKKYYIWSWKQQGWEVDQEIDGKIKWGNNGRLVGGKGWKERVYNREEWKKLLKMASNSRILHMPVEWMNEWIASNWLCKPPSLLFNGYWRLTPLQESSWHVRLTNRLHLVMRLTMSAAILPLPHTPSQHAQGQMYFNFKAYLMTLSQLKLWSNKLLFPLLQKWHTHLPAYLFISMSVARVMLNPNPFRFKGISCAIIFWLSVRPKTLPL